MTVQTLRAALAATLTLLLSYLMARTLVRVVAILTGNDAPGE